MANINGNSTPDIVHAKLPISTVFTVGGFLIAQIIAFTYFVANMDNRISTLEFENQRLYIFFDFCVLVRNFF